MRPTARSLGGSDGRERDGRHRGARSCALIVALALLPAVPQAIAAPTPPVEFPSPLAGPGAVAPPRSEARRIAKAWSQLEDGRVDRASRRAAGAGDSVAARLLRLQIDLQSGGDPTTELQRLLGEQPGYASAWYALSVAAERAGQRGMAYDAARLAATLWPSSPWSERSARLHREWVETPLEGARHALAEGAADQALEQLQPALAVAPKDHDLLLAEARCLVDLGRLQEASQVLEPLLEEPAATMLAGEVAEREGHWTAAMERYESAPEGTPGRAEGLERARLQWRLLTLPRYAQEALASPDLTRAQLAALLVNLVPAIETVPGGRVPLLSDIMDTPGHREIVTAVRLGLLDIDELEHRFDPGRPVRAEEVRRAIDRLASVLGLDSPRWCEPSSVVRSSCTEVAAPVSGHTVADVVLRMVRGEG